MNSLYCVFVFGECMSTNKNIGLPDFIEASIAVMYPDASEEKLGEIRTQWIEQLALRSCKKIKCNYFGRIV